MRLSMWTYAWDIQDQGLDNVVAELRDGAGLNTVSLATSYHAGHFLQPRSTTNRSYFPQDGTVYYRPQAALWEGKTIRPLMAQNVDERGDMLAALVASRENCGPKVSCWTVCLHNTRLGLLHPGDVTRSAFGDPNPFNLCPSSPAAREYVCTMVADISSGYQPDMIELESPNFMGFLHGFHHEKDGVGLLPEDDFFFSLCFCPHCRKRAHASGVNVKAAQAIARDHLVGALSREMPASQFDSFPQKGIEAFRHLPDLYDFLVWRSEPVTSLIGEIRDRADPESKIVLIDLKDGFVGGVDLAAVGKVCDGAILCGYDMSAEGVRMLMAEGRQALGPDKYLGTGFRVFYPELAGASDLTDRAEAASLGGADGINFYNYGLIPKARLGWVRQAVERCRQAVR